MVIAELREDCFEHWEFFRCLLLAKEVSIFKTLSSVDKIKIMGEMTVRSYTLGTPIVSQGEVGGEEFFIILEGSAVVEEMREVIGVSDGVANPLSSPAVFSPLMSPLMPLTVDTSRSALLSPLPQPGSAKEMEKIKLATLREGHSFGEMSLVSSKPRVASVTAASATTVVGVLTKTGLLSNLSQELFDSIFVELLQERKQARLVAFPFDPFDAL